MLIIKNLTRSKVEENFLRDVAEKTQEFLPKFAKKRKKLEIELIIVGEKRIKSLNKVWRGKDAATDVLSFGNNGGKKKTGFILAPDNINNMGEIFICYPAAARQARQYGSSVKEEMARLLVHGILHLAGYDHEKSASEARKMFDLQEKIAGEILKMQADKKIDIKN